MGFFSWLFSGRTRLPEPPAIRRMTASADGARLAVITATGRLLVWDTATGEALLDRPAPGPGLALSADGSLVTAGDGCVRRVADGESVTEPASFHGHAWFLGDDLLRVGADTLTLGPVGQPPRVRLERQGLDLSAEPDLVVGPGGVALVDPAWDDPLVLDPAAGTLTPAAAGQGPTWSAAWRSDTLLMVREGQVYEWRGGAGEKVQPHGLQTLAVAVHAGARWTLGLDARDRYEAVAALPEGERRWSLPGRAPERPWLLSTPDGVVAEAWTGFRCFTGAEEPVALELPLGPLKRRPLQGRTGGVDLGSRRVALATWPPTVYRAFTATFISKMSIDEDA
ncbi:MAG: hypothetical protein H6739_05900 [Alphaproteobacteria bacterium]|nr:hypothetical protein [Alphaproteobacteria bacterium]